MRNLYLIFFSLLITLGIYGQAMDYSAPSIKITTQSIVDGLDIGWGMAWLPDGSILVTEKSGKLYHCIDGKKNEIQGIPPIFFKGQGGLLDVIVHPQYSSNQWVYLSFSTPSDQDAKIGSTAIARGKIVEGRWTESQWLYSGEPKTSKGFHFGSRMVFDDNNMLFFSIGDRGEHFVNPQDLTRDGGKVYRIHDDGRIPTDNPFIDIKDARTAIYSYGHRNPQGMIYHPDTKEVWVHEHGPKGGDEINIVKRAANYGWPVICYGINYDDTVLTEKTEQEGMEQPLYYYLPSIGPSGFAYINTDKYPGWKGDFLIGSLSFNYLEKVRIEKGKVTSREKILADIGRVRDVRVGPDGYIYISVEGQGILKLITETR
jgi:aldose sugar dehydrogenase